MKDNVLPPQNKGVIELLWDIFGGTINEQGYKVLDPHIGAIYGDSITPERQREIYERLAGKGFAATNIVLGVGSYTYQYNTRDTLGFATKGAWFEVEETQTWGIDGVSKIKKSYNIYKDPVTDDGTKKSLKGLLQVYEISNPHIPIEENGYFVKTECTPEQENEGLLQVIYEDGKFYNQTTLNEVRERLKQI
jgi:nicotinamide phosphoribosyltransferase